MKPSELRDKNDDELRELEKELRDKLVQLSVAKATQRARNFSQFGRLRKDIARVQTILNERRRGIGESESGEAAAQG